MRSRSRPAVARLIDRGDPADPIARQLCSRRARTDPRPAEDPDPIGDELKSPLDGVVHRYRDRALIKLVSACAVYCRFCFRREMVGPGAGALSDARIRRGGRLPPRASRNLGGGADRRRSAGAVGAAPRRDDAGARRDPTRQNLALAHAPAGRRPRTRDQGDGAGADARPRQDRLCRAARQPSARIDQRGARGVPAADR